MNRPLFSILHPSARPGQWRKVYDDWMSKCVDPSQVEYVLCADERWGFDRNRNAWPDDFVAAVAEERAQFVWNTSRRCYVDAVNTSAKAATGQILIVIADDQFACEGWDKRLYEEGWVGANDEFVIEVSTGSDLNGVSEHDRGIFVMPIVSRARYERLGYLFYPEYESMYADNDLCEHARKDGVVIDARQLMFPHKHPLFNSSVPMDEAYAAQNRPEAYELGRRIFTERQRNRFARPSEADAPPRKPVLALVFPGEHFSGEWVKGYTNLFIDALQEGFIVQPINGYTSNPYVTRMELCEQVLREDPQPEFVLWIDDDNVPSPGQFTQLYADLKEHPDVDVMAGWCWIHFPAQQVFMPSCGTWREDGIHWTPYDGRLWSKEVDVRRIDVTGFPFLLMRFAALEKAGGPKAFLPLLDDRLKHGVSGEDIAWCKRAGEAGVILAADPRVKVDHLKTLSAEPYIPESAVRMFSEQHGEDVDRLTHSPWKSWKLAPRIAGMLRVKNESRWIKQVIESISELCDAGIFVLDDNSTDNTRELCREAGAPVYMREFCPGIGLDEARDKNWLMDQIVRFHEPNWILCIDGDEELEPNGAEKIRAAIRDASMESFTLRVPYLWDSPDQWRVDGIYRDVRRHSIFRPRSQYRFKSLYSGAKQPVHTGLHCSNSPLWQMSPETCGNLDVALLHYGYMYQEDRVRKYHWYNKIDPNNEMEDRYRHMVIGDVFPASMRTKYGGPLQLEPLPEEWRAAREMMNAAD